LIVLSGPHVGVFLPIYFVVDVNLHAINGWVAI